MLEALKELGDDGRGWLWYTPETDEVTLQTLHIWCAARSYYGATLVFCCTLA